MNKCNKPKCFDIEPLLILDEGSATIKCPKCLKQSGPVFKGIQYSTGTGEHSVTSIWNAKNKTLENNTFAVINIKSLEEWPKFIVFNNLLEQLADRNGYPTTIILNTKTKNWWFAGDFFNNNTIESFMEIL